MLASSRNGKKNYEEEEEETAVSGTG